MFKLKASSSKGSFLKSIFGSCILKLATKTSSTVKDFLEPIFRCHSKLWIVVFRHQNTSERFSCDVNIVKLLVEMNISGL